MAVTVKIPTQLRAATGGQAELTVEGSTVGEVLDALYAQHDGLRDRICGDDGELRRFVNVYVGGEDIRFLDGLGTAVPGGGEVTILPAVAGALSTDREVAERAARAAGEVALRHLGGDLRVEVKSAEPTDVVTVADRAAEAAAVAVLADHRPADGVFGEEGSDAAGTSGRRWIIDAIDGTLNFSHGLPAWCAARGAGRRRRPAASPARCWTPSATSCSARRAAKERR